MDNRDRAERAFRTLLVYRQRIDDHESDEETVITDLITDLFHLSDEYAVNMESCFTMAEIHYNAETEG